MSVHWSAIAIGCVRCPRNAGDQRSLFADTEFAENDIVDQHAGVPEKLEGLVHRLRYLRVEGLAHLLAGSPRGDMRVTPYTTTVTRVTKTLKKRKA